MLWHVSETMLSRVQTGAFQHIIIPIQQNECCMLKRVSTARLNLETFNNTHSGVLNLLRLENEPLLFSNRLLGGEVLLIFDSSPRLPPQAPSIVHFEASYFSLHLLRTCSLETHLLKRLQQYHLAPSHYYSSATMICTFP